VLAESGRIEYRPVVDMPGGPNFQARLGRLVLRDRKWDGMAALAAHVASPHMAAYAKNTRELRPTRTIHILTGV
jgi:quinol monooxygenase YgiN